VIKGREVPAVELQWCWLQEMEMGKVRRWGATIFRGEEGGRQGSSTVLKVDDTGKSSMAAGEVGGGS
jgi:hypothetical protein